MRKINVKYPEFPIEETIKRLEKINDIVSFSPDEYVLCHNDLLADNFMLVNNNESMYINRLGICRYGYMLL